MLPIGDLCFDLSFLSAGLYFLRGVELSLGRGLLSHEVELSLPDGCCLHQEASSNSHPPCRAHRVRCNGEGRPSRQQRTTAASPARRCRTAAAAATSEAGGVGAPYPTLASSSVLICSIPLLVLLYFSAVGFLRSLSPPSAPLLPLSTVGRHSLCWGEVDDDEAG